MKMPFLIAMLAMLLAGCCCQHQSKFKNDPRAAVVGPAYLDYIQEYPRDRDTQYYYPSFKVTGITIPEEWFAGTQNTEHADIQGLLTEIPPIPPSVQKIEGKGWPELESTGIPLFTSGKK